MISKPCSLASYAPTLYHGMEPWGILSLKHAAACAGLGAFGRSEQMHHPKFGSLLRLAAVVTDAALPGDPVLKEQPCPSKCSACHQICPSEAFEANGKFSKITCMQYAVKHAIYPLALKSELGLKHIERVINAAGHNYWLACDECLKVCPLKKKRFP